MLRSPTWLALALLTSGSVLTVAACDWDTFDPRIGAPAVGGGGGNDASGGAGGTTSTGGSATTGVGAGGPTDCGRISLVSDTFDATDVDDVKWDTETSSGTVTVAAGDMSLGLSGAERYGYSRLRSEYYYDMRDAGVAIEVSSISPSTDPNFTLSFFARRDDENNAEIRVRGDQLQALRRRNDQTDIIQSVTYNPSNHRWWRIRHDGDAVFYEFSADGVTWGVLAQMADIFVHDFSFAQVLVATAWSSALPADMMDRTVVVGEIVGAANPGAPDGGAWCKAETLTDDFNQAARRPAWRRSGGDSGSFALQSEGEVVLGLDWNETGPFYEYRSAQPVDLRDSFVSVEMTMPVVVADGRTYLEMASEGEDDEIEIGVVADIDDETMMETVQLRCVWEDDGDSSEVCPNVPYDADAHRFFRIREEAGTLYWEVSADGEVFSELARLQQHPFALEDFWVKFGGSANTQMINPPPEVRFDNFNLGSAN